MYALNLWCGGSAYAATFTVNASGGADYTRIQDAINKSNKGIRYWFTVGLINYLLFSYGTVDPPLSNLLIPTPPNIVHGYQA
jgi:hypothetical protein